ncbi:hypothetical protein [Helcococcus bovis]|uniref:hypothetical protein n=1 Tax=Helcococcus bovis TaxID=3153252 RepID=UPI0038B94DDA
MNKKVTNILLGTSIAVSLFASGFAIKTNRDYKNELENISKLEEELEVLNEKLSVIIEDNFSQEDPGAEASLILEEGEEGEDKVVRIVKHGHHYHLYTQSGKEFVTYTDPSSLYPEIEIEEYQGSHGQVDENNQKRTSPTNTRQNSSNRNSSENLRKLDAKPVKKTSENDGLNVASIKKHGDHYHLYDDKGREFITYQDPSSRYPHIKIEEYEDTSRIGQTQDRKTTNNKTNDSPKSNQKTEQVAITKPKDNQKLDLVEVTKPQKDQGINIVEIKKHGNHYHLYDDKGNEYVTYEDPSKTHPNIKIGQYEEAQTSPKEESPKKENQLAKETDLAKKDEKKDSTSPEIKEHAKDLDVKEETETPKKDELELVEVIDPADNPDLKIVAIKKHDDHYHLYDENGNEYLTYKDPSEKYPHIAIEDFYAPSSTYGDSEEEFERELFDLARAMNVAADKIQIKDGEFIVPHHDHFHNFKIQSKGWKSYLENQIPNINVEIRTGEGLNRRQVKEYMDQISEKAGQKFGKDNIRYRRIQRVLDDLEVSLSWGGSTTSAYMEALEKFEKEYITGSNENVVKESESKTTDEKSRSYKEITELANYLKKDLGFIDFHKNKILDNIISDAAMKLDSEANLSKQLDDYLEQYPQDLTEFYKEKQDEDSEKLWETLQTRIRAIDENKNLSLKLSLLSKLNSTDEDDIESLKKLEAELDSLENEPNQFDKENEAKNLESLRTFLSEVKNDPRSLGHDDLLAKIDEALKNDSSKEDLEALKAKVKDLYKKADDENLSDDDRAQEIINELEKEAPRLSPEKQEEVDGMIGDFRNRLNDPSLIKANVLKEMMEYLNEVRAIPNEEAPKTDDNQVKILYMTYEELEKRIKELNNALSSSDVNANERKMEISQMDVDAILKKDSIANLNKRIADYEKRYNIEPNILNLEELGESGKSMLEDPQEWERQVKEVLDFLNKNRRNIPDDYQTKVQILNRIDELEHEFKNASKPHPYILDELLAIKAEVGPILEESTTPDYSGWL